MALLAALQGGDMHNSRRSHVHKSILHVLFEKLVSRAISLGWDIL
jgi:hypothetical protein